MKNKLYRVLLLSAAALSFTATTAVAQNYCESNAAGELQSNIWTCYGTATRPTISGFNGDSLVVKHAVSWGVSANQAINLSGSTMSILSVRSGGIIGPGKTNNTLIIPTNSIIMIYGGGSLTPLAGNNSNHILNIGSICVWGKKCCSNNNTINGPAQINASTACSFAALPVELLSFNAKMLNGYRVFTWIIAMESNVSHYILEESADGNTWNMAAIIPSKGNSNEVTAYTYSLAVFSQAASTGYRLSQTNYTGETQVLKTISMVNQTRDDAVVTQTQNGIHVFINPDIENVTVRVYDVYGKTVYLQSDISSENIDIALSDMASGMYIVTIINISDHSLLATQKIVLP